MTTSREQADQAADRLRDELLTTVDELERRWRRATDVRYQLASHVNWLAAVGAGAAILISAALVTMRMRRRSRRTYQLRERVRGFMRAWEHPDRLAKRRDRDNVRSALVRKAALAFAAGVGARLARQGAAHNGRI